MRINNICVVVIILFKKFIPRGMKMCILISKSRKLNWIAARNNESPS